MDDRIEAAFIDKEYQLEKFLGKGSWTYYYKIL
jgi:hypothetical protein